MDIRRHGMGIATVASVLFSVPIPGTPCDEPGESLGSAAVLVQADEPGQPLIVSGTVYGPRGVSPQAGVRIHVYNTDAEGWYSRGGRNERDPRIQGTMITDELGRYEFRTIKPGTYPDSRIPAHIHFAISGPGTEERRLELRFQDDPFLPDGAKARELAKGSFGSICSPEPLEDGALRCGFDIKLD